MKGRFSGVLLAADFDNTLRPEGEREIPKGNLTAIGEFMEEGGMFVLCTGRDLRSYASMRHLLPPCMAVLSNGAVLYDGIRDTLLRELTLPDRCRLDIREWMERWPEAGFEIHRGADIRVCRPNAAVAEHLGRMGADVKTAEPEEIPLPWTKIAAVQSPLRGDNPAALALCEELVRSQGEIYEAAVSGGIVDIASAGLTKAAGVKALCALAGIDAGNVYAVGDGLNDLPMLLEAAEGFVPSDSVEAVLRTRGLTHVGPCTRHAVRDAIELLKPRYPRNVCNSL